MCSKATISPERVCSGLGPMTFFFFGSIIVAGVNPSVNGTIGFEGLPYSKASQFYCYCFMRKDAAHFCGCSYLIRPIVN